MTQDLFLITMILKYPLSMDVKLNNLTLNGYQRVTLPLLFPFFSEAVDSILLKSIESRNESQNLFNKFFFFMFTIFFIHFFFFLTKQCYFLTQKLQNCLFYPRRHCRVLQSTSCSWSRHKSLDSRVFWISSFSLEHSRLFRNFS
jgi:hypothetical protein